MDDLTGEHIREIVHIPQNPITPGVLDAEDIIAELKAIREILVILTQEKPQLSLWNRLKIFIFGKVIL